MIDYDELRKDISRCDVLGGVYGIKPHIGLQLLRIIAVAKDAIKETKERIHYNNTHRQRYEDRNDEQTIDAINYLLDDAVAEIAKLENE